MMTAAQTTDVKTLPSGKKTALILAATYGESDMWFEYDVGGCSCLENEKKTRRFGRNLCTKKKFWKEVASKCDLPQNKTMVPLPGKDGLTTIDHAKQLVRGSFDGPFGRERPWMSIGIMEGSWTIDELDDVRYATRDVLERCLCMCRGTTLKIACNKIIADVRRSQTGPASAEPAEPATAIKVPIAAKVPAAAVKPTAAAAAKK